MDENEKLFSEMAGKLDETRRAMPELLRLVAALFETPPWPRAEMDIIYRFLADEAGLPSRCPHRRCRRLGQCGNGLRHDHPACIEQWEEVDLHKLEGAWLGLVLGWMHAVRRHGALADMIAEGAARAQEHGDQVDDARKSR